MNHGRPFFLLISFLLLQRGVSAQQELVYENLTSERGLSENVVYCLLKDKRGFIWAGTDYGLNRYDGYRFKHYYSEPADSTTLSGSAILCIAEDRQGFFWIGTYEGLNFFNPLTGKARRISRPGIGTRYIVEKIKILRDGSLLLLESSRLFGWYSPRSGQYRDIPLPAGLHLINNHFFHTPDGRVAVICYDQDRQLSLWVLNERKSAWEAAGSGALSSVLPSGTVYLFPFGDSALAIRSSSPHFFLTTGRNSRPFIIAATPDDLRGLLVYGVDRQGDRFWVATNKGVIILNVRTGDAQLPPLKGDIKSLEGYKEVRCVLNDGKGSMWLGTFGEGMLRCDYRDVPFRNLPLAELSGNRFGRMIFGLYPGRGDTVIAEAGANNYIKLYKGRVAGKIPREKVLSAASVYRLTTGKELADLPVVQRNGIEALYKKNLLAPFRFILHADTAVISYLQPVVIYTPRETRFVVADNPGNLYMDADHYWIPNRNGLLRIRKLDLKDSLIGGMSVHPESPAQTRLYHVAADQEGGLWIGTRGAGLYHLKKSSGKLSRLTTADGLPDNVVYTVLPDGKGHLWLTTNKGISKFNLGLRTFTNYSRRDGLLNSEYNRMGAVMTPEGWIYLAGTSGIDYFLPDDVYPDNGTPQVQFSEVKVSNREILPGEPLQIPFSDNNLSVFFTAGDYIRPDLVYYRYRLHNHEPWVRIQGQNFLTFNALQPGRYQFEVQAGYDNINWSEAATLHFVVKTPWWKSLLFFASVAILFMAALYGIYRYRLAQVKRVFRMRASISQDLHDEVGSALSSIHIYSTVADKAMDKEPEKTREALRQISSGTQRVMENMGDIVWAINVGQSGNSTLEVKMKNYGYELLTPSGIRCSYDIDPKAEDQLRNIRVRKNLLLVAKEALNNIAKYSGATEVLVRLQISGSLLHLLITDNGRGFDPENVPAGNGLYNMRQRMEELDGTLEIISVPGEGVRISCNLPVPRNREA